MKRSAKQELTKEILQTGEMPQAEEQEKEATPEEIASRRILKIKASKNTIKQPESTEQLNSEQEKSKGIQLTAPLIAPTDSNPQQQQQQPSIFSSSLFSSIPTQNNLFVLPPTGLFSFGSAKPIGSIGGGLFGNASIGSNLFGNASGSGLFASEGWKKSGPAQDEDDDEEGGNEPLEDKSEEGNPEQNFEKIVNVKLQIVILINTQIGINKIRVNQQDPSLQGFISLEKLKDNKDQYIIVYRNATKLILHQGIVLKITQFSNFNNREDCLQMGSYEFVDNKEEESKDEKDQKEKDNNQVKKSEKKLQKNILKIMFKSKEDCKEFTTALENAINQLKKPEQ